MIYEFDEFQFEPGNARLSRRGVALRAEPKAMRVLEVLLDNNGLLVDRETLLDRVWGRVIVTPGTLTRLIAELRRLLGDDSLKPRFIETVHTKGYRWIAPSAEALLLLGHEIMAAVMLTDSLAAMMRSGEVPNKLALDRLMTAASRIQTVRGITALATPPEILPLRRGAK